jgi:outer membrane scaffolding protein for murein synthesis (MipA/OmpV family)
MKSLTNLAMALCLLAPCAQTAMAQNDDAPLVPLPSVEDFTQGQDGFSVGLGLGLEYESAYEGSDEFGFEVSPAGAVQWRRGDDLVYFAGEALGWRGLRWDTWLFDAAIAFDEGRAESDSDDGRLDGLGDGQESTEIVLKARHALTADWRYWLDGRVVASDKGTLGLLGVGRRFGAQSDGSGSDISLVAVFNDGERANRDFGINAAQSAASGLTAIDMGGGFRSIGVNYTFRNVINDHWQLFGEVLYEHFGNDVTRSPITREDYEAEVGVGFVYTF